MRIRICFALIGVVLFAFQGLAVAQKTSGDAAAIIKASITIDSETLTRDKQAIVTITLENVSGRELDLTSISSFYLNSLSKDAVARKHQRVGDSYWGPVTVSNSTPTKLDIVDREKLKKGIVVGRVPEDSLKFTKDEIKSFKVDLTKLLWSARMLSDWPHQSLFDVVPRGSYGLSFGLSSDSNKAESNAIEVSIK